MTIRTLWVSALVVMASLSLTGCESLFGEKLSPEEQAIEDRAAEILSRMTLEEKIGQIIQADISAVTPEDAKQYNLGSVLNGGNSAPGGGKTAAPEAWIALADEFWDASTDTSDGGVGIPLLWGTDAVHGHNNLQSATIFPHNIGLGAANDLELIGRIASVTAKEIRATGLDWTFAPTLAVAQDDRWGRTYESYSENPDIVAAYSGAMVTGLQGEPTSADFLKGEKVIATAKHFVADGGTQLGIDKGDAIGDLDSLLDLHGAGYGPAIAADVQVVMASFSSINGIKMHGYKELLTDVLRGEMGFNGFVIGDWNGHAEIPGCSASDCVASLDAGVDMYMAPDSWRELYSNLLASAKDGSLSMERLDQAVMRILRVKIRSGLLDGKKPSARATSNPFMLGADGHRAIAREAVRKSLVLLKNQGNILPIKAGKSVLVAGSGADSIEQQSGGWTLNWQGDGNSNDEFQAAQTIYDGLNEALTAGGGTAILSPDGSFTNKPDVAVVVFGEAPYAEYRGDRSDLVFEKADGKNLALLKSFQAQNIPVVAVFLSGRPMWMNAHINASDAFVAAWLPGTEGGGVADVLIGDTSGKARYDFTGKLSFSWPKLGNGEPVNGADAKGALFPLGYGLNYTSKGQIATLSEDPGIDLTEAFDGNIMERGDAAASLSLYLGDSSNANIPAAALVSQSLSGSVKTRGVDYKAQEDAREIIWSGQNEGQFSVRSNRSFDLAQSGLGSNLNVMIEWRVEAAADGDYAIALGCGEGCAGALNASGLIAASVGKGWTKTSIPLSCFTDKGFDTANTKSPFILRTKSAAKIAIHAIKLVPAKGAADCSIYN